MKSRTKPEYWKLEKMPDPYLLRLALNKLKQRTIREGEKMDEKFDKGERDEKQRSKFYAIWYAFEALRIYAEHNGIKIDEPFITPSPVKTITVPSSWQYIDPKEVFLVSTDQWKRFSKEDQKFLRQNKGFHLKQLGYPLIHTDAGTFYDWGTF